ncbi:MAG TPA: EAL domain-containing protein [Acidimicrobiales bacterium]|nr:EAL domain-containing protein [Acidimicrobiales bacterium]
MKTRLWAGPANTAATGRGVGERRYRAARAPGAAAYMPVVGLGALSAALALVIAATWVVGSTRSTTGHWAGIVALGAAVVAAGLAAASAVTIRHHVLRPLDRLERLATDVVASDVAVPRPALPTATGGGHDMETLVDAVETLAAEVESTRRALRVVQLSPDVTMFVDPEGNVRSASPSASLMLGRPAAWMTGRNLAALVHPEDRPRLLQLRTQPIEPGVRSYDEVRLSHLHGHWVVTEITALDLGDDPAVEGRVLNIRDVSDRKAHEEALVRRALYDPLTGLANRVLFREHVDKALARLRRTPARPHAVLFVDLDGFKTINDSLGHAAGDEVLAEVGHRLLRWMRPGDTAARLGGDEFAVLLENTSQIDTGVLAKRILDVLLAPIVVQGKEVVLTGSIGIALSEAGQDSDTLLRNADAAMYTAKAAGKGQYRLFEPEMHQAAMRRLDLEADLRRALDRDELYLAYQPIVDLETGRVTAAEVLARWEHPERGHIPPLDFISVAEDSGYIRELGRHILEQACRTAGEWHRRFPDVQPLRICVNTSVRQIEHPEFFGEVSRALADARLDGSYLTLEITESLFMSDFTATVKKLRRLKDLGLKLAVDDFGTGYSSLSYLRSLPIDILKIDKSFVVGVTLGAEQSAVARAVVKLARTFNLRTVAEGIEQQEQAVELLAMGADMGQGYWFGYPLRAEAMEAILGTNRTAPLVPVAEPAQPTAAGHHGL